MTAKRAILAALSATGATLATSQLIEVGALFDIEPPATRVALSRLVRADRVVAVRRGEYQLSDRAQPVADAFLRWREMSKLARPWEGRWLLVHTLHLGRSVRKSLRAWRRALALMGFAEWNGELWIRPDNLALPIGEVERRLQQLGLDDGAIVVAGAEFSRSAAPEPSKLWDRATLETGYTAALDAMRSCSERKETLSARELARDSARIGFAVVGMLSFDPLLPDALVDASKRVDVQRAMMAFDELGKSALRTMWES